jgi:hypothetical protein
MDVHEEETTSEARDISMTATKTATMALTESEAGALSTNDLSDPAQLRKVIRVDNCGASDRS